MTFPSPALPTPCSKAQAGLGQPRLRQTRPPPALPTSAQPGRLRSPAPSRVATQASGAPAGLAAALRAVGRRAREARPLGIHTATAPPATGLLQRHHLTTLFRDHAIPDHSHLTSAFIILPPRVQQTFSVKGQILNIFSFVNHTVSVTTVQFCCCNMKATIDNMQTSECDCSNKSIFMNTEVRISYNFYIS